MTFSAFFAVFPLRTLRFKILTSRDPSRVLRQCFSSIRVNPWLPFPCVPTNADCHPCSNIVRPCRACPLGRWSQFLKSGILILAAASLALTACDIQRRKSDAELGLNPQQSAGRRIYDNYCDRCHAPYSSRGRQGPSMKAVFQRKYLPMSGMPANDDRVTDVIRLGRDKMPAYGQVLDQQQINDLLAYLHTL